MSKKLRLRYVDPAELEANPHNFRTHPAPQIAALGAAIDEVGWAGALLYNERTKRLIDGHARKEMFSGKGQVPVLCGEWTEEEEKVILATLDPIGAMAIQDAPKLHALMQTLETDNEQLKAMLKQMAEDNPLPVVKEELTDPDAVPEAPAQPVSRSGDLWVMGGHRLLCGDSTDANDVERVMDGHRAGLMNTDPPYGVAYANDERPNPGVAKPRVANDGLADEELQRFLETAFGIAVVAALLPNAAWYMWHAHLTQGYFAAAAAAAAANVVLHRQIIWAKPVLLLGRGQYHLKHEPCFMGWVEGNQPPDYGLGNGERTQTTIWEIGSVTQAERKQLNHSTPKPVGLFEIPIVKHLKQNEIAYEPFSGSGPQIIAAEKLDRRCFAIEISPQYVDVAVRRWCEFTGKDAVRESDGASFRALLTQRDGEGTMKP